MTQAEQDGQLHPGTRPRRAAALTMRTAMFIAQTIDVPADENDDPVSADEVWEFCSAGSAESSEAHP